MGAMGNCTNDRLDRQNEANALADVTKIIYMGIVEMTVTRLGVAIEVGQFSDGISANKRRGVRSVATSDRLPCGKRMRKVIPLPRRTSLGVERGR